MAPVSQQDLGEFGRVMAARFSATEPGLVSTVSSPVASPTRVSTGLDSASRAFSMRMAD